MIHQITNSANRHAFTPLLSNGASSYAITKPFTNEMKAETETHKEKKSKALGVSIAVTALAAGAGALFFTKWAPKALRGPVQGFLQSLGNYAEKLKDNPKVNWFQKLLIPYLEKAKNLSKNTHTINNTAPLRDVTIKRIAQKIPFVKEFDNAISKWFEKISIKTADRAYKKTSRHFEVLNNRLTGIKVSPKKQAEFEKRIVNLKTKYAENFGEKVHSGRLAETTTALEEMHEKMWSATIDSVKNISKKSQKITENGTKIKRDEFISETLASVPKKNLADKVIPTRDEITEEIQKIIELCKGSISPQEFEVLDTMGKRATKSLNKSTDLETDKLFNKIRDLKIGSAISDVFGVFTSLLAVGWGLSKADGKDERTSVALKYGVPVVGAMLVTLYCTVGLISGGTALLWGLGSGVLMNKLGGYFDKKRKQYNEVNKLTFPELNPINLLKSAQGKQKLT